MLSFSPAVPRDSSTSKIAEASDGSPLQLPHDAVPQRHALLQVQNLGPRRLRADSLRPSVHIPTISPHPRPRGLVVRRALRPCVVAACGSDLRWTAAIRLVNLIQGILIDKSVLEMKTEEMVKIKVTHERSRRHGQHDEGTRYNRTS